MLPAARVQSAIGILDTVIESAVAQGAPADRLIATWARNNRYAGSKDRRAIRELVYRAIRACGPVPPTGRGAMLRLAQIDPQVAELFDGSKYGPPKIGKNEIPAEGGIAPRWLADRLIGSNVEGDEADALLSRASLDLRVNTLKASRDTLQLPETPEAAENLLTPNGLRLPSGTQIEQWEAYKDGLIEVQDSGSQVACLAVNAKAGETVIDMCAGAGGKTLALAAAMENGGELIAADTDRGRLSRLVPRANRAGALIAETILLNPGKELDGLAAYHGKADAVLVDAPCSGTGTWRRNPEARWRLNEESLMRVSDLQQELIKMAASLVKPGGRIIYATCSMLDEEGPNQIAHFLRKNPGFSAQKLDLPMGEPRGDGIRLTPFQHGTDGFFIASICNA